METNDVSAENASQEDASKGRQRMDLKHVLPDSRLKNFDQHLRAIAAYANASPGGKKPLKYTDFQGVVDYNVQLISGLNKFFEDIGLVESVKGLPGSYRPTTALLDFQNNRAWKHDDEAKRILRELVVKAWFWEPIRAILSTRGSVPEDELTQRLGVDSNANPQIHRNALKTLLEYLTYVDLITKGTDGGYQLGTTVTAEGSITPSAPHHEDVKVDEKQPQLKAAQPPFAFPKGYFPAQIILSVDSNTTPEKVKELIKAMKEALADEN